jgi:sodium pump decarboxylase gamma subunit
MENVMTMADRIQLGITTTVVGLGIVLAVLAILWGVLELFRVFFYDMPRKKAAAEKAAAQPAEPAPQPVVESPKPAAQQEDEEELIAVLTAAVAAAMGTSANGLYIKSYRRTDGAWGRVSRKEQLDNRL